MNGWHVLAIVYLGIGFASAIIITSREAIDYYRSVPDIRRDEKQVGRFVFGVAILIAAMLFVVAWPLAFVGDHDGD